MIDMTYALETMLPRAISNIFLLLLP